MALLTAFFNENVIVKLKTYDEVDGRYNYSSIGFAVLDMCRFHIYSRDSYVVELIQKLEKKEKELVDIKRIIDSHNEQSWYDRIERIHYNSEE